MNARTSLVSQRRAAARLVARLIMRDRLIDSREIEFLDRSGAYGMLGIERTEFMAALARCASRRSDPDAAGEDAMDEDLDAVSERSLQLVVAALLVYISDIDRQVQPAERRFVEEVFDRWEITPEVLQSELRVPAARSTRAIRAEAA